MAHQLSVALILFYLSFARAGGAHEAAGASMSPMEKVITMIGDLQTKVLIEGKRESITYDQFACFCKDMSAEKAGAITSGEDTVSTLEASIGQITAQREDLDDVIAGHQDDILGYEKEMKAEVKRRTEEYAVYIRARNELKAGQEDLGKLMAEMEAGGQQPTLLQLQDIRSAVALADALGLETRGRKALSAFLQQAPSTVMFQQMPAEIFDTLKTLNDGFDDKIKEVKHEEQMNNHEHEMFMDDHNYEKKIVEKDLADASKQKSSTVEELGKDTQALTEASGTLIDDKQYIQELTNVCNRKAQEWDQRSTMRQTEITALGDALATLKASVEPAATDLAQQNVVLKTAVQTAMLDDEDIASEVEEEDDNSFVQVSSPRHRLAAVMNKRKMAKPSTGTDDQSKSLLVASLLRERGLSLKSQLLLRMASHAGADPLAKVKHLIQELIERLLQEAADEANQKGWCDREMGKAKKSREEKVELIKNFNGRLAADEVKREKLTESVATLDAEITELESSLSTLEKERAAESAENTATIEEAQTGKEAVDRAVEVLSQFYGTAAKATVDASSYLLQKSASRASRSPEIPDAGFEGAYKGLGGATGGVMGMLDVILSDYEREISVTQKVEAKAAKEFLEIETQTKISTGTKTVTKQSYEAELIEVNTRLQEDKISLTDEQALLDKTLQELSELRPACVDTGMSYEEKIAKRDQEMTSLKEALGILEDSSA